MKSIFKTYTRVVPAAFASAAIAQSSPEVKYDTAQMQSDKGTLPRKEKGVKADKAKLKAGTKEGRMAADKANPKADEKK